MGAEELIKAYQAGQREFQEIDLPRANLANVELVFTDLTLANLREADLKGAILIATTFTAANLSAADLSNANLINAEMIRTNLRGANLNRAILSSANLQGANLSGAILTHIALNGADLTGATLQGADLQGANLRSANLTGANLWNANLKGVDLEDAILNGTMMPDGTSLVAELNGLLDEFGFEPASSDLSAELPSHTPIPTLKPPSLQISHCSQNPDQDCYQDLAIAYQQAIASPHLNMEAFWAMVQSHAASIYPAPAQSLQEAQAQQLIALLNRQGAWALRQQLLQAYGTQCAITGPTAEPALEVASIVPFLPSGTHRINNSLLLRADIRTLFELHQVTISPQSRSILVAPALMATPYGELLGQSLHLPKDPAHYPSQKLLEKHFQACSWVMTLVTT